MDSPQKEHSKPQTSDHDDEAAGGKMWAVYVAEAEKYDRALIESWKSDMAGMLIFAGLFSAIVVAFLVESYKTLTPDSGNTTILLLNQISNQLAAAANGTTFTIMPPTAFTPQTSSLVCNILWFLSLGLSLTCALVATLVEQWAREFMHKADMRSAPVIRARVFSYLYYGMKRFKMHTVVGIIPLLLHTSLLFFFAGLVAFLIPVNLAVTVVAAILLLILAAVYMLLTSLPLDFSNKMTSQMETMVEVMFHKAGSEGSERLRRDKNALVWTMKSLADDTELETFIESVPDILWGPSARRSIYEEHIHTLINDKDPHVKSCDTGLLTSDASSRRRISCYQATWAIGSLTTPDHSYDPTLFHHIIINAPDGNSNPTMMHYSVSAVAISRWASFCAAQNLLKETLGHLNACNSGIVDPAGQSNMKASQQKLLYCLQRLKSYSILLHHPDNLDELSPRLKRLTEEFGDPYTTVPFASQLETQKCISPLKSDVPLTKRWLAVLEGRLERIIYDHMYQMNTNEDSTHWLDKIVKAGTPTLPQSEAAVKVAMDSLQIGRRGKRFIPATIMRITRALSQVSDHLREQSLTDLWAILSRAGLSLDLPQLELIINEVSHIDYPLMTPAIAVNSLLSSSSSTAAHLDEADAHLSILANFLQECQQAPEPLFKARETIEILGAFIPGIPSTDISYIHPSHQLQFAQAVNVLVAKVSDDHHDCLPLFTAYTLQPYPGYGSQPQNIWTAPSPYTGMDNLVQPLYGYAGKGQTHAAPGYGPQHQRPPDQSAQWLTSTDACQTLKQTLERYMTELPPNDPSNNTLMIRIQGIITTLSNIQGLSPEGIVSENKGSQPEEGTSENNGDAAVMQQNDEIHDEVDETTSDETSSDNVDIEGNEIYPPALWPYTYPPGFDTWIPPDIDEHEGTPGNVESRPTSTEDFTDLPMDELSVSLPLSYTTPMDPHVEEDRDMNS
ncbi:hypothetical protein B0H13DRAFT_2053518 [Mycena leptocephala]|nr:hypothetical protein B0H13DRAFT_2053518 [Mycena leptocephala]